ncbi:MAG: hypothetical protein GX417_08135 [Clostridiales bacterium]|nr:hypothetical protein [Clostridiales bacterium]
MTTNNNQKLVSYLTAAEAFNEGKNIYDSLLPLVESILITKSDALHISFLALQQEINNAYHLSIPKTTLRFLLSRLNQQGKIVFSDNRTIFPVKNELNRVFWENHDKRELNIEDFFIEFSNFLLQKNIEVEFQEIKEQCCLWIFMHSIELAGFVSKGKLNINPLDYDEWIHTPQLIQFLLLINSKKTTLFETFLLIYNGALQASLLNFEPQQIDNICESGISLPNVILDTNFILRILNLQSEFDVAAANETLNSLQNGDTTFYILEQTIEEIQTSIRKFLTDIQPYTIYTNKYFRNTRIQMSGFWDAYRRGVSKTNFLELANRENLIDAIRSLFKVTFVNDFNDENISSEDITSLITSKNRNGYSEKSARHDLALIEYCRKQRRKKIRIASDIDWWVLTNDERLSYWNQYNCGEYQECLTEVQLSNLLWLHRKRNPSNGLMQTIVSLSCNTSVSYQGVTCFASKIDTYKESHKDDTSKLDKLAILLASNTLTAEDIQKINAEEDALDAMIDEKMLQKQMEQFAHEQVINASKEKVSELINENKTLTSQVTRVTAELETEKFARQIDKLALNIERSIAETNESNQQLVNLTKMREYSNDKMKSSARILAFLIVFPIIVILLFIFSSKCTVSMYTIFQSLDKWPSSLQIFLIDILFPVVIIALYYLLVVCFFGSPKPPKEAFLYLSSKFNNFRRSIVK